MEHFETAVVGLYVQCSPEERLNSHESTFNYGLSQRIITYADQNTFTVFTAVMTLITTLSPF